MELHPTRRAIQVSRMQGAGGNEMPVLELTDEQVITLLQQLPEEQKQRVLSRLQEPVTRPVPQFGIAKGAILYMAPDFDAPLDDFKEYME